MCAFVIDSTRLKTLCLLYLTGLHIFLYGLTAQFQLTGCVVEGKNESN